MTATLYVAEFQTVGGGGGRVINAPLLPTVAEQCVEICGESVQSEPFAENTNFIRLVPDIRCAIVVGLDPEASTDNMPLLAGGEYYFSVGPGPMKLAVISST